jgi:CheY-like chemotaxis protein
VTAIEYHGMDSEPIRILVLEDSNTCFMVTRAYLEKVAASADVPVEIVRCLTVAESLDMLDKNGISLIFADLNVPDSFGLQTVSRLVAHGSGKPIVVLSGSRLTEPEMQRVKELRVVEYFDKATVFSDDFKFNDNVCRLMMVKAAEDMARIGRKIKD